MDNDIEKLDRLIKDVKVAMLTTLDENDGSLRSRPMATLRTNFDGELWFFTSASSHTVRETRQDYRINLSYSNPDDNVYVSVSGFAMLVHDKSKAKDLWNPLLRAWFPHGLDDPDLALLKVHVEKAEYWDSPHSAVVTMLGFVKAIAAGRRYEPSAGEHQRIDLSK